MFKKQLEPMRAIGRLSNPFVYETEILNINASDVVVRLADWLNVRGQAGWKLHTIERLEANRFFCVWEKLDYGEKKA